MSGYPLEKSCTALMGHLDIRPGLVYTPGQTSFSDEDEQPITPGETLRVGAWGGIGCAHRGKGGRECVRVGGGILCHALAASYRQTRCN